MPRKAFLADLKAANSTTPPNITAVEAGLNSGTFSFIYLSHFLPQGSVIIHGEVPEVSDYPTEHQCFLFITTDQTPPPIIPETLNKISAQLNRVSVEQILKTVSSALNNILDPSTPTALSDGDDGEEGGDSEHEEYEDELFTGDSRETARQIYGLAMVKSDRVEFESTTMKKIRSDLRAAKRAGFKVGVLGDLTATGIVCVSIRVTKLGISEEAMKAWGLRRKQYLVLMIRFLNGYQTIEQVQQECTLSSGTQIRVGLCEQYKPAHDDATSMFAHVQSTANDCTAAEDQKTAHLDMSRTATTVSLEPLFIGGPINDLFRDRFSSILKYRLGCGFPWSGAEIFYQEIQGKSVGDVDTSDPSYLIHDDIKGRSLPPIVVADTIEETISGTNISFPLVAMQFLLRHFVRCTEFCLVCHCRVDTTFEALKPYVCSKSLCLYQYMALGFGPSIGWEIITQPYVVDVLVSFCYASARYGRLNDFPSGIAMRVPLLPLLEAALPIEHGYGHRNGLNADMTAPLTDLKGGKPLPALFSQACSELVFESTNTCPIKKGDWLVVQSLALDGSIHYRVLDVTMFPSVKLDGEGVFVAGHKRTVSTTINTGQGEEQARLASGHIKAEVFLYNGNFDDLTTNQQRNAVLMLLDTLPGVLKLRDHLMSSNQGPDPQLRSRRHDLSESALNLLRWIIASNRSCIMQVDKLADKHADGRVSKAFTAEDRVSGMDDFMQFRFAQGAPDKEQRFINCVNSVTAGLEVHPTIFAWHGSPIGNWHGIVREGLHFNEALHGRAYGNGVYMSQHAMTSLGYSGLHHLPSGAAAAAAGSYWPNSALKISSAISLNEVVNCPTKFVSQSPHYVVSQLDWIQTRYLFVRTATICHAKTPTPTLIYEQDPARAAHGTADGAVVIPITAVSKSRRPVFKTTAQTIGVKKAKTVGITDQQSAEDAQDEGDSDISELEDREYLDSDMEDCDTSPAMSKATSNGSRPKRTRESSVDLASSKVADLSLTDFVPGSLDTSRFKMLREPTYATTQATVGLSKTLRELVKVQQKSKLHELGWYIDASKIENLYQWLIELHSFDRSLPLSADMKAAGLTSIVLEMRFSANFPFSPPFVRVVTPRFLAFLSGGGGHVTNGGAICMELLTNDGWLPTSSIESVLLQIRMAISSTDPRPARLEDVVLAARQAGGPGAAYGRKGGSYGVGEAVEAFKRACRTHGWKIPADIDLMQQQRE